MKSTYKFGIAALMASVLTYTGCVNNLTDDVDADASISAAHVAKGTALAVSGTDFSWDSTDTGTTYASITFNMPLNKSTVASGITVYKLTGETLANAYTETALSYTPIFSNSDTTVTLPLTLKDVYRIRVFIDPTVIAATNGAKLDTDGDKVFGEDNDDDLFAYVGASNVYSSYDNDLNFQYYYINTNGTERKVLAGTEKKMPTNESLGSFNINTSTGFAYFSASQSYTLTGNLSQTLSNAKVQHYDTAKKEWVTDTSSWSLYPLSNSLYYATFTPDTSKDVKYRVYTENVKNLVSTNEVYGYVRKVDLNNKNTARVLTTSYTSYDTDNKNLILGSQLPSTTTDSTTTASTTSEAIISNDGTVYGTKVNTITFPMSTVYATYRTDNNYANYINSTPYLYLYNANGDSVDSDDVENNGIYFSRENYSYARNYAQYSYKGLTKNAATSAAKLHFFTPDYKEVKAEVTQSYVDGNDFVVVFDKAITIYGTTLYVYAESDFSVDYTRVRYDASANAGTNKDTYPTKYLVSIDTVSFTAGTETDRAELLTPHASSVNGMRKLATISF